MDLQLSNEEQAKILMAQSAQTMATTMFWKLLTQALAVDEANCLAELDLYLVKELHPDREEVMTLVLKWHARRAHRRLLLDNVKEAQNYKPGLRDQILQQFMDSNADKSILEEMGIPLEM